MSQYANPLADRSYPLTAAYYHRTAPANSTDGSSVVPMPFASTQGGPHQSQNWPQYYAEHHSLPQPSNFNTSYASSSSSPPAGLCVPYTDVTAVPSVGNGRDASRFVQDPQSFIGDVRPLQYQSSGQCLLVQDYPTSSQRTNIEPSPPPPPQLTSFVPMYEFQNNRDTSPSSPTSVSDYESGTNWESPERSPERLQYMQSRRDGSPNGSPSNITEAVARCPSLPASTTTSIPAQTSVKIEPDDPDGCFIMELPSFPEVLEDSTGHSASARSFHKFGRAVAPPTEVPLRATQASKEMRGMMGVFRLNPFAMHSLSVGGGESIDGQSNAGSDGGKTQASWCGEAGPLEEKPVTLEFQLDVDWLEIDDEELSPSVTIGKEDVDLSVENLRIQDGHMLERLRSFSPSFEPQHPDDMYDDFEPLHRRRSSHQSQEQDYDTDLENESWRDGDIASRSEVDTSSTTTRSVHTPFYDSPQTKQTQVNEIYEARHDDERPQSSSAWDTVGKQYLGDEDRFPSSRPTSSSGMSYVPSSVRVPKLHTTTSHPYLRKSQPNLPMTHGQSQNFPHTHSYIQPQSASDASFPIHQTENNAHITGQYLQNHHPRQLQQNHVPSYSVPVVGSDNIVDNFRGSTSYMRKVNRLGSWPKVGLQHLPHEEQEYEQHGRVCSPSSASSPSNEAYMYTQATEAPMQTAPSAHAAAVHTRAMNVTSNRRWSLPETGHSAGHGVGHGGSFLSFM